MGCRTYTQRPVAGVQHFSHPQKCPYFSGLAADRPGADEDVSTGHGTKALLRGSLDSPPSKFIPAHWNSFLVERKAARIKGRQLLNIKTFFSISLPLGRLSVIIINGVSCIYSLITILPIFRCGFIWRKVTKK